MKAQSFSSKRYIWPGDRCEGLGYWSAAHPGDRPMSLSLASHPALAQRRRLPNRWDVVAMICVFGALVALVHGVRGTLAPI